MDQWMEGFHTYLAVYANPLLDQPEGSEAPGPVESVQVGGALFLACRTVRFLFLVVVAVAVAVVVVGGGG